MNFKTYWDEIKWHSGSCFLLKGADEMFELTRGYLDNIFIDLDDSEFYLEYLI